MCRERRTGLLAIDKLFLGHGCVKTQRTACAKSWLIIQIFFKKTVSAERLAQGQCSNTGSLNRGQYSQYLSKVGAT